jgi:hypothetical protein
MDDGESHSFKNIKIPPEMLRFKGMVSIAFDAYMYLYIEHQDRYLLSKLAHVPVGRVLLLLLFPLLTVCLSDCSSLRLSNC